MGTYTTVDRVATFLGLDVDRFGEDSSPTKAQVEQIISAMEDYVDRYTRHAWREKSTNGYEYHKMRRATWRAWWYLGTGVYLRHRKVRQLDPDEGDSLQVFNGTEWEEWLGVKTEAENGDFWLDYDNGILYIRRIWWLWFPRGYILRIKYRYGETSVPEAIRMATTLLVAAQLVESGDYVFLLPEGAGQGAITAREKIEMWRTQAHEILDRYTEVYVVD